MTPASRVIWTPSTTSFEILSTARDVATEMKRDASARSKPGGTLWFRLVQREESYKGPTWAYSGTIRRGEDGCQVTPGSCMRHETRTSCRIQSRCFGDQAVPPHRGTVRGGARQDLDTWIRHGELPCASVQRRIVYHLGIILLTTCVRSILLG